MKRIIISDDEKNNIRQMHESFKENGRVVEEQTSVGRPLLSKQMEKIKPDVGGKYCFSNNKIKSIESINDTSYIVYKIKAGDTINDIAMRGNGKENIELSNDLCPEIKQGKIKVGDVIIYSLSPSGRY